MNARDRKELARVVADCCERCRGMLTPWLKAATPEPVRKSKVKPGALTARGLGRILGSLPKAVKGLVAFRAGKGVEGTDGEAWASFKLKVKGDGAVILDGSALARWLKTQKGEVGLMVGADALHVEIDRNIVGFPAVPGATLPKAPAGEVKGLGETRAAALAECVKSVQFSAGDKEIRYAMNGIAFDGGVLATTNGRSLASVKVPGLKELEEKEQAAIFQLRLVPALFAVLRANGESKVKVALVTRKKPAREYMRIVGPAASLVAETIEGRFPAWREVVPKHDPAVALVLDAKELAEGLLSLAALTPEDSEQRAIKVSVEGADVTLTHSNGREASVEVQGSVNGPAGESHAYIDPRYMADALKTQKGEVIFEMRGQEEAVMLKAGDWQYVLMPVTPPRAE